MNCVAAMYRLKELGTTIKAPTLNILQQRGEVGLRRGKRWYLWSWQRVTVIERVVTFAAESGPLFPNRFCTSPLSFDSTPGFQ